ncbi:hypothetical protein sscle_07g057100 [Sclerotinia sclerotiorum 1980 UF-70]|uniref:Uncharacterized protein n=1 Tax=Sclerotinia sclerotiorum (strain ATCC 18683 / 1980 / Ss-1) TaxID=665079 RepID=A0A1D9Q7K3_SCLS1|nr:hypothetical protein sscle_07g057100 [Sclerotinia sclerotiorum 1980 UF-70]
MSALIPLSPYVPPRARVLSPSDRYSGGARGNTHHGPLLRSSFDNGYNALGGNAAMIPVSVFGARAGHGALSRGGGAGRNYNDMNMNMVMPIRRGSVDISYHSIPHSHGHPLIDPRLRHAPQVQVVDPSAMFRDPWRAGNLGSCTQEPYTCPCHECEILRLPLAQHGIQVAPLTVGCHHDSRGHSHAMDLHNHCCSGGGGHKESSSSSSSSGSGGSKEKSSSSGGSSSGGGSNKKEYGFPTKDIVIRGKTYACRKSFLADQGKFEDSLVKMMEKKKEDEIPTTVLDSLFSCINEEVVLSTASAHDLVTLNVLASSLGVKSVMEKSLAQLKKQCSDNIVSGSTLTGIVVTVMMSAKVDEGLREWLKKYIKGWGLWEELQGFAMYIRCVEDHPEIHTGLLELLGLRRKADGEGYRII